MNLNSMVIINYCHDDYSSYSVLFKTDYLDYLMVLSYLLRLFILVKTTNRLDFELNNLSITKGCVLLPRIDSERMWSFIARLKWFITMIIEQLDARIHALESLIVLLRYYRIPRKRCDFVHEASLLRQRVLLLNMCKLMYLLVFLNVSSTTFPEYQSQSRFLFEPIKS